VSVSLGFVPDLEPGID